MATQINSSLVFYLISFLFYFPTLTSPTSPSFFISSTSFRLHYWLFMTHPPIFFPFHLHSHMAITSLNILIFAILIVFQLFSLSLPKILFYSILSSLMKKLYPLLFYFLSIIVLLLLVHIINLISYFCY